MNSSNISISEQIELKSNIAKNIFGNLKSNFFMRKILEYLTKKKSLEFIKRNKCF